MNHGRPPRPWLLISAALVATLLGSPAGAQTADPDAIFDLDIDALAAIRVTSVSKKPEAPFLAPSAISVITREDIRRSGHRTIAEALRMVPGMQVARINSSNWAVSARGFNSDFANKLLVLIDGRNVYNPIFAGVYWDVQDVMLEDVDRIEVIRGPGATLWGANAVNGVINVVTSSAKETQGGLVSAGGGLEERGFAAARYGGRLGDAFYRIYLKYDDRDGFEDPEGRDIDDDWRMARAGFRIDRAIPERRSMRLSGEVFHQDAGQTAIALEPIFPVTERDGEAAGGHVIGRWEEQLGEGAVFSTQAYVDVFRRNRIVADEDREAYDLELQYRRPLGEGREITLGGGYRHLSDSLDGTPRIALTPSSRETDLYSGFVQVEQKLLDDRLRLIAGTKLEHNDFTGFEVQPSGRVSFAIDDGRMVWGAISRALRTPARADSGISVPIAVLPGEGEIPAVLTVVGDTRIEAEKLVAYEIGYRWRAGRRLLFDLTGFYNDYEDLVTFATGEEPFVRPGPPRPFLVVPLRLRNGLDGETFGAEAAATWEPVDVWRGIAAYSWLDTDVEVPGSASAESSAGGSPQHQLSLRSELDLSDRLELDGALYYVDTLSSGGIGSYVRLDVRLGWRPRPDLELALVGQNLGDPGHVEFDSPGVQPRTEIQRAVYAKVVWRFGAERPH